MAKPEAPYSFRLPPHVREWVNERATSHPNGRTGVVVDAVELAKSIASYTDEYGGEPPDVIRAALEFFFRKVKAAPRKSS